MTTPGVKCNFCGHAFSGGATRIREHLIDKCTCDTEAFCELKTKLIEKQDKGEAAKRQKTAEKTVDAADEEEKKPVSVKKEGKQTKIEKALAASSAEDLDAAIAELFAGCNIDSAVVMHPLFQTVIDKARHLLKSKSVVQKPL